MSSTTVNPFVSETIETEYVDGPGARYAYRRFGKTRAPALVMCIRFRGTIDHWDPALLDLLAAEREVITFDDVGRRRRRGQHRRPPEDSMTARCSSSRHLGSRKLTCWAGRWAATSLR